MSKLGQYYINEYDELGMLTNYEGGDVALVSWHSRNNKGKFVFKNEELRYLPYLTPIDKVVADIMIGIE
jgi:hypothetical protein